MKKGRIILSSVSGLLLIALLIGSTGATIIIKNCRSCGTSANLELLSYESPDEHSCCADANTCTSSDSSDNLSIGCCTFTTKNLKLTNYYPVKPFVISFIAEILPVFNQQEVPLSEEQYIIPLFVHNKHGSGRNITITNRQFLI